MKNNRKNKKLSFIRIKNLLRTGKRKFYCTQKVNNEFDGFDTNVLIELAKKSLFKEYKLSLPLYKVDLGLEGDDFIKDMVTYRVILYLK